MGLTDLGNQAPGETSGEVECSGPGTSTVLWTPCTVPEPVISRRNSFKNAKDTTSRNKIQPQFLKALWTYSPMIREHDCQFRDLEEVLVFPWAWMSPSVQSRYRWHEVFMLQQSRAKKQFLPSLLLNMAFPT